MPAGAPPRLSIVIPTLDEAVRLPRLLGDLRYIDLDHEIIVADGGSTDGTPALAERAGARVVRAPAGRGSQLRAGATAARGEWLLVLHADARIPPEALAEARAALDDPQVAHAAWPLRIDAPGRWLRVVEWGAALRWRLFGLAYGDQGLLVRRALYEAAGGYPDIPIFEDVALIRRLGRAARGTRFRHPIVADGRRWRREGAVRRPFRNLGLLALYLAGASPARLARWYRPEPPSP